MHSLSLTYLIAHECGDAPANLVEPLLVALWTQQYEDEPCGYWYLCDVPQHLAVGKTHKRYDGVREKVHLSNQHVRGLGARGNLLHEATRLWGKGEMKSTMDVSFHVQNFRLTFFVNY